MVLAGNVGAGQPNQPTGTSPATTKKKAKAVSVTVKKQKDAEVAVTGSLIPRKVRRSGWIADGVSPMAVIDRRSIELSGARDVADLLKRGGWNR